MTVYLSDVLRPENGETGLHYSLRIRQTGYATDTKKIIHKFGDGSVSKYVPEDQMDAYGQTGVQGLPGATGANGLGAPGVTGLLGSTGLQGATGLGGAGSIGETGSQGETGASIVGPQGVAGLAGSDGSAGPQGVTGLIGFTGAQGVTGVAPADTVGATGVYSYIPYFDDENHLAVSKIRRVNANYLAIDCNLGVTGLVQGGITVQHGDMIRPQPDGGYEHNTTGTTWYGVTGMASHLLNETTFADNKLIAYGAGIYYVSYSMSIMASDETVSTRIHVYNPDTTELFLVPGLHALGTSSGYNLISNSGLIPCDEGATVTLEYSTQSAADLFIVDPNIVMFRVSGISV